MMKNALKERYTKMIEMTKEAQAEYPATNEQEAQSDREMIETMEQVMEFMKFNDLDEIIHQTRINKMTAWTMANDVWQDLLTEK